MYNLLITRNGDITVSDVDDTPVLKDARKILLKEPVEDYFVREDMSVCELVEAFGKSHGFMAGHVYAAAKILAGMWSDKEATRILAFTGNLVSTGLRGVLAQLIREGFADAIITTCGTIDHDIARGLGYKYYKGDWLTDDSMLRVLEIHRLGNVFIPMENYGLPIEKFVKNLLDELLKDKKEWSPSELLYEAGKRIKDPYSILAAAAAKKIPVFVPGIVDGAFGSQLVFNQPFTGLKLDLLSDERKILDIVFESKKLGGLIIGGGISKHHTIWWAQFKDGLDYAVYITTAVEYDGSLSGAQPREAISWNKIKPSGKQVVVYGDATVFLPIIVAGARCLLAKE